MVSIERFDCGCKVSRSKDSRLYGSRWKVYKAVYHIVLKCLDCGKVQHFQLSNPNVMRSNMEKIEDDELEG